MKKPIEKKLKKEKEITMAAPSDALSQEILTVQEGTPPHPNLNYVTLKL